MVVGNVLHLLMCNTCFTYIFFNILIYNSYFFCRNNWNMISVSYYSNIFLNNTIVVVYNRAELGSCRTGEEDGVEEKHAGEGHRGLTSVSHHPSLPPFLSFSTSFLTLHPASLDNVCLP